MTSLLIQDLACAPELDEKQLRRIKGGIDTAPLPKNPRKPYRYVLGKIMSWRHSGSGGEDDGVQIPMLAKSSEAQMHELQKLLTHRDFRMTQLYAHLRGKALKKASNVVESALKGVESKLNIGKRSQGTSSALFPGT